MFQNRRLKISPFGRNDKKRTFRSDTNYFVYGDNTVFLKSLPKEIRNSITFSPVFQSLPEENYTKIVQNLYSSYDNLMTKIGFGPIGPQWCSKELLVEIKREASRLAIPIHLHCLETVFQKIYSLSAHNKTMIAFLKDIGFLGDGLTIGHCVWAADRDIQLIAETGTGVTHHPSSNLRLRSGIAPLYEMLRSGVLVGLGMDSNSMNDDEDFFQEMRLCSLIHRITTLELESPCLTSRDIFQMATENNAKLLGFGREIGRIEKGRRADLVMLDFESICYPYTEPSHDDVDVLIQRGLGRHVHTVVVNGKIVVQNRQILTVDEKAIASRLAAAMYQSRSEEETRLKHTRDKLRKHILHYYKGWARDIDFSPYYAPNSRIDGIYKHKRYIPNPK